MTKPAFEGRAQHPAEAGELCSRQTQIPRNFVASQAKTPFSLTGSCAPIFDPSCGGL